MELIRGIHKLRARQRGSVVGIGNFDGLHPGHRAVLGRLREQAASSGGCATVVTFEPLPREHFDGVAAPARLQPLYDRLAGLRDLGIDLVLCLRFDSALARMPATEFAERVLAAGLATRHVVVGADFRFGQGRQGDHSTLAAAGFEVETAATVEWAGARVSSTRIRAALQAADLAGAAALLGRDWAFSGRVRRGEGLGRSLGYPTANLRPGRLALAQGIYAVRAGRPGEPPRPGVASWGTRPTVGGREPLFEVHLFDLDQDLYGARLAVTPVRRLRDELKFAGVEALQAQMDDDADKARAVLAEGTG